MMRIISPSRTFGFGRLTQSAGTAIVRTIAPKKQRAGGRQTWRTRIVAIRYTAGLTAHTLTIMRPLGTTTLTAAAAASATVINIAADAQAPSAGGALAANDYLVLELSDGTFQTVTVSSVASLAITIGTALTASMLSGAKVWCMGIATDHNDTYALGASAVTILDGYQLTGRRNIGLVASQFRYEPIIVYVDNITNAGVLEQVSGFWANH